MRATSVAAVATATATAFLLAGTCAAVSNAPGFELPLLDGSKFVRAADFSGRPLLVNFWASECPPCVNEMPLLAAQAARHPAAQFIGVAVDGRARALRFLWGRPSVYPQLEAPRQPEVLLRRFGNLQAALPFTVVLDPAQRICASRQGEVDARWISAALAACAAPASGTTLPAARSEQGWR